MSEPSTPGLARSQNSDRPVTVPAACLITIKRDPVRGMSERPRVAIARQISSPGLRLLSWPGDRTRAAETGPIRSVPLQSGRSVKFFRDHFAELWYVFADRSPGTPRDVVDGSPDRYCNRFQIPAKELISRGRQ